MIQLPAAADPEVSVMVILDGGVDLAERALRAIADADPGVAAETVVLLNDPDDELEAFVRRSTRGAKQIRCRANAAPGVGSNLNTEVAGAPRIATLHEDSEPQPGWLRPLCETMDETGAGAVGSRLFNADGSVQNCGWVLFSDATHQPLNAKTAPEVAAAMEPTPADVLSGAAMLLDREAVRAAGGWDERFYPALFMDIDISTAMWSRGRPVFSVPASRVLHASGTFDRRPNSLLTGPRLRLYLLERNRPVFAEKWGELMDELTPPPSDAEPETVRSAVSAALPRLRARAERVRATGPRAVGSAPRGQRRFTGVREPVLDDGQGGFNVAPAIETALREAESELVEEYVRWLIEREAQISDQIATAYTEFAEVQRGVAWLESTIENLQRENQSLTAALDHVRNSRTWRLRTRLARLRPRR